MAIPRSPAFVWTVALVGSLVLAASAPAMADDPAPRDAATCGRPGQPRCPMQSWMRTRLAEPSARGKLTDVADALVRLGASPPDPTWTLWTKSSSDGAAAARRGDAAGVRESCRTCHAAYRREFRKEHRLRPAPP